MSKKDGHDKLRDVPPVINDPACAEFAERFMRGETVTNSRRGRRKVWSSPPPRRRKGTGVSVRGNG